MGRQKITIPKLNLTISNTMNNYKNHISRASYSLIALFSSALISPVFALSISGGAMTLNIDGSALASAFTHNYLPDRPSFYLEEYFDSVQAVSRTPLQLVTDHIIPGTGKISGIGRQFTVNSSSTTGLNKATNFNFDPNDLEGTASGEIGLGGAMRFRLNKSFVINPETGEEETNRAITGYLSLEYDADSADPVAGHSGWTIFNHHSFRADVFNLDNVTTTQTGGAFTLSGKLALAHGFDHLGGKTGTIVGDFNFQTTVVPVPAAVWLFASGLAGLFVSRKRKVLTQPL